MSADGVRETRVGAAIDTHMGSPVRQLLDLTIAEEPRELARVRGLARDALLGVSCADTAELVLSELINNAFLHGHPPYRVAVTAHPGVVVIEVRDASTDPVHYGPTLPNPNQIDALRVVESVADRLGVVAGAEGRTVWAHVYMPPESD